MPGFGPATGFYPALPCPALPCPALPCPALPCPALPCPALPCPAPALPCPALPRPKVNAALFCCRVYRTPDSPVMSGPFAMLLPMGTLESTKHKSWTWILGAPLATLREAGVAFDPEARGLKAIQGDADSGSALEVWAP